MSAVATTTTSTSNAVVSSSLGVAKLSALKLFKGGNNKRDKIRSLEQLFTGDHDGEDLNIDVDAALARAAAVDGEHPEDHDEIHEEHHDEDDGEHHDGHDEFQSDSAFSTADETNSQGEKPKPWGYVILATLLVNFASLSGLVLLVIPAIHHGYLRFQGSDTQGVDAKKGRLFDVCVPAFAVGALMSTAFFLVMPEAMHLIEGKHSGEEHSDRRFLEGDDGNHDEHSDHEGEGHNDEDDSSESLTAAKFGVAVLGGFLLPMLFGMAFHRHGPSTDVNNEHNATDTPLMNMGDNDTVSAREKRENKDAVKLSVVTGEDDTNTGCDCCTKDNQDDVETGVVVREVVDSDDRLPETIVLGDNNAASPPPRATNDPRADMIVNVKTPIDYRLIAAVIVGDAFCNFVDGLFIGAAFLSCAWGTTLSILLVTLFHELPQEMADFLLLTRYAGLSTIQACVVNFGSGLIVTLGGLVVLVGETSDEAVGVILAMAGGCYINIAACETVPRMEQNVHSMWDRVAMLFSFIMGTVPIGLVLLKHEHC